MLKHHNGKPITEFLENLMTGSQWRDLKRQFDVPTHWKFEWNCSQAFDVGNAVPEILKRLANNPKLRHSPLIRPHKDAHPDIFGVIDPVNRVFLTIGCKMVSNTTKNILDLNLETTYMENLFGTHLNGPTCTPTTRSALCRKYLEACLLTFKTKSALTWLSLLQKISAHGEITVIRLLITPNGTYSQRLACIPYEQRKETLLFSQGANCMIINYITVEIGPERLQDFFGDYWRVFDQFNNSES